MDHAGRAQILQDRHRLAGALAVVGRDPDIQRLARPHDRIQRAHGFLERRVGVEAVRIEDVDIVQPQPLQRLVARGDDVFPASPFAIGPRPHQVAGLGRHDQLVPIALEIGAQDVAEHLLGPARRRAVVVGEVEMGDPQVEGRPADPALQLERPVPAEIVPQPQRHRRQHQAGAAAAAVDHLFIAVLGGLVGHGAAPLLALPCSPRLGRCQTEPNRARPPGAPGSRQTPVSSDRASRTTSRRRVVSIMPARRNTPTARLTASRLAPTWAAINPWLGAGSSIPPS